MSDFKLTYASLFNPPEEIHERFEAALAQVRANYLGKTHAMLINNQDVVAESTYETLALTNDTVYGLTGGFFGTTEEAQWYSAHIQVGTSYANRLQGASTGAWPGYQAFGGWKQRGLRQRDRRPLLYPLVSAGAITDCC